MFGPIEPAKVNGLYEAMMGGARPRVGTPPFSAPFPQTGGTNAPTTPGTLPVKHGLSGFIDRLLNPTNALGQFGQALLASSGGPLGNAIGFMLQQRAAAGQRDAKFEDWKRTYDYEAQHPKPSTAQPYRWERNDGSVMQIDPETGEAKVLYADPNPKNFTMQAIDNGDGTKTLVPVPLGGPVGGTAKPPATLPPDFDFDAGVAGSNAGRGFPVNAGLLDRVTAQGESGGRDFRAPGRPVTSPKGARFAMQVMPDTARDPGFGLRPANPSDPADMNRLGREYRAVMQQRYGGDLRKMWAAYNMGPGALESLIAKHGEDGWFARAPKETRDYIRRNLAKLGAR